MSKPAEIDGLQCSAEAGGWAVEVLRTRFAEIAARRAAVLESDDVEAVHQMRVATRRLRSALRDFAPIFRKRPLKTVKRELKNLADRLGAARDEDVALGALGKLKKKAKGKAVREGLEKLFEEGRARRRRARRDLLEPLAAPSIEELEKRFAAALDDAARKKSAAVTFTDAGRAAVLKSLAEFCGLSASLYAPFRVKKLHKLRIAAKRLRYAVELFTPCWAGRIAPFAEEIAKMQSFLGEVHDADEWLENSRRRLLENDAKLFRAEVWLLSRFAKRRTKNYRRALKLWHRWKNERFIEKFRETISQPIEEN